ncbi:PLDc N-terminal domain-containing protein [Candidatus Pacearchaeota archaeon]|nr:PLDc N-terminal domain-containing protein [Candidatus Pacearchaeota archaeon]
MIFRDIWFFPFVVSLGALVFLLTAILFVFWIWMLIDCAQRRFLNNWEKVVWLVVIVFGWWIGSLVYFIVVRTYNPRGIAQTPSQPVRRR